MIRNHQGTIPKNKDHILLTVSTSTFVMYRIAMNLDENNQEVYSL